MAQNISLSWLLLLLCFFCIASRVEPSSYHWNSSRARAYVEAQCRNTLYPKLCVQCLSGFVNSSVQSPQELAQIALRVALVRAQYARAYMTQVAKQLKRQKARDYQAVKDCLQQIGDAISQITQSVKELQLMGLDREEVFNWDESNIQSWVSAAQTDAMTCLDGLSWTAMGGKVKATIKAKVLNVAQHISNALALFDRFAARHRASKATHKPRVYTLLTPPNHLSIVP